MRMISFLAIIFIISISGCEDLIEEVDISNETVMVLAPVNQVVLNSGDVLFTWEAVEQANRYHLQIAVPNFENAQQILADTNVVATHFFKNLEPNQYQWRIRAENSTYFTNYTLLNFSIEE
ncbi:hypothetical protein FJ651_03485 [Paucihalobacter ruber]|uniref:Uncharacterized protein n=1 Tax=Paucihalobacter ruber TaxID=2567861 RepID=A0A506PQ54_9FLAO|nr:hypothetical protein [Paucihalobacter ruber]TPV35993.1 hypothetical protein FJ651_03485 [Paucihalobacter ruber]